MTEKIQICAEKALTIIQKMVKTIAITREMGVSDAWIANKQNHNIILASGEEFGFAKQDMKKINDALHSIGERLLHTQIRYSNDRDAVISQIKDVLSVVKSSYIYDTLGKKKRWFESRLAKPSPAGKKSSFSEDDITNINLIIKGIAINVLSIEVTL